MLKGIRLIDIQARTAYPIVSAFEFHFLKKEAAVQQRIKNSSIYCIIQRRLTLFQNMTFDDGKVTFDIYDGSNSPLKCELDLVSAGIMQPGEVVEIEVQSHEDEILNKQPYQDVAAFKVLSIDGTFRVWETPQKILYEFINNDLPLKVTGNIQPYLTYKVHYIGKSWSQAVWNRLDPHTKFKDILTVERPISKQSTLNSFEISLLLLDVIDFTDIPMVNHWKGMLPKGVSPKIRKLKTDDEFAKFMTTPPIKTGASELTAEAEALLIHTFRPEHNGVKYRGYPNISNGTRSVGYTAANLTINGLPVILFTDHHPAPVTGDVKFPE